ncbi:response regulator transcription factor [Fulvivirga sediminis]|uniref:Helix-turn-helix transcriptional regulator n=1 Tax=Fulvivirga sediminis TaxID=2803949 RepID=A0A937F8B0_9BACT|nr:helix-turn-helix transcriptional regulator [Fulvivirga sediminis]MBL3655833.1 helix-turn-helix transcriptional regulator [Fulvivirga sediminis]
MNIKAKLDKALLGQTFENTDEDSLCLRYQSIAKMYAEVENAIAVLSDLKTKKSLIYYGGISSLITKTTNHIEKQIHSIWEDEILDKLHPEDLKKKQALEYYFIYFLKDLPTTEWKNYYTAIHLRIRNNSGEFIKLLHRMFYATEGDSLRLALCIYNLSGKSLNTLIHEKGLIINSTNGSTRPYNDFNYVDILSGREKEVLRLIAQGKMSKEIAELLNISLNTVNRHRQNILQKLRVKNSIEAYRMAKVLELIE